MRAQKYSVICQLRQQCGCADATTDLARIQCIYMVHSDTLCQLQRRAFVPLMGMHAINLSEQSARAPLHHRAHHRGSLRSLFSSHWSCLIAPPFGEMWSAAAATACTLVLCVCYTCETCAVHHARAHITLKAAKGRKFHVKTINTRARASLVRWKLKVPARFQNLVLMDQMSDWMRAHRHVDATSAHTPKKP